MLLPYRQYGLTDNAYYAVCDCGRVILLSALNSHTGDRCSSGDDCLHV